MVFFNAEVLPESNHRWRQLMVDIGRKSPLLTLHEQTLNSLRTGDGRSRYYLQAARIDPMTNRMRDVVIYDVSDPRIGRTIYADSGRMAFNDDRTDLFYASSTATCGKSTSTSLRTSSASPFAGRCFAWRVSATSWSCRKAPGIEVTGK